MVGLLAYYGGDGAAPAYAFYFFWVVLAASYLFGACDRGGPRAARLRRATGS